MKFSFFIALTAIAMNSCAQSTSQKPITKAKTIQYVGDGCEGCEAIHESPVPFKKLSSVDTLPDFNDQGQKIQISGIVYHADGKTPAKDIVLYVYHTDQEGVYPKKGNETGWGKRHGYLRGWLKTDSNGFYQFYTLRPSAYPGRKDPAHIHITVKEPDKNEYWIDDFLFDDDPKLTKQMRKLQQERGGDGIMKLIDDKGFMHGTRHIILGKNVPDYLNGT